MDPGAEEAVVSFMAGASVEPFVLVGERVVSMKRPSSCTLLIIIICIAHLLVAAAATLQQNGNDNDKQSNNTNTRGSHR